MNQNRSFILSNSIYLICSRFTALIIFPSNILFEILKCFHSINFCFLAHLDFSEHIFSGVLDPPVFTPEFFLLPIFDFSKTTAPALLLIISRFLIVYIVIQWPCSTVGPRNEYKFNTEL